MVNSLQSMSMNRPGVLIIGLDGGTWTSLQPAIEQGCMPFLAEIKASGSSGILESTIPAITPAAWSAFQTGRNPGSTGVYDFSWWNRTTHVYNYSNATSLDRTIWELFSNAGKSVAAINVPMMYPPKPVNGIVVSGLMTPSLKSQFTYPSEFKQELLERIPGYDILGFHNVQKTAISAEAEKKFLDSLVRLCSIHADAACYVMHKQRWDLFMLHFQETDVLQHQLWKYLDTAHPDYDPAKRDWIFSAFYRHLDKQMERLYSTYLASTGQPPLLVILSDHGFESHHWRFNLGNWLSETGYLCIDTRRLKDPPIKGAIRRWLPTLHKMLPLKWYDMLCARMKFDAIPVLWEKTKAFACGSTEDGFIYLLADDPQQRELLIQELTIKLMALKDPVKGQPLVSHIYRREEIYHGNHMDRLPDLVLRPAPGYSFNGVYRPDRGLFRTVKEDDIMNIGKHHPDGMFAIMGPHVIRQSGLRMHITDMLPTLLVYSGLSIPSDIDGRGRTELFDEGTCSQIDNSGAKTDVLPSYKTDTPDQVYSSSDEQLLQQRLRDLGYME